MNISVIGAGYVGLTTAVGFAELGHQVICMDQNQSKIKKLQQGILSIYEPGLERPLRENQKSNRLSFTSKIQLTIQNSQILFIAVGTPPKINQEADLTYVWKVIENILQFIQNHTIIIIKSTVPVGTTRKIQAFMKPILQKKKIDFDIASNPEFLKEGSAFHDFIKPDRIIVGIDSDRPKQIIQNLYSPLMRNHNRLLFMDTLSAELTKYAANAMLASRISFMNEMSALCEKVGADIEKIRQGIGSDSRIGWNFLYAGLGYGGSCFPKDLNALIQTAQTHQIDLKLLKSVQNINQNQRKRFIQKVFSHFNHNLNQVRIAIWGLAFKSETDDMRESPSIDLILAFLNQGSMIHAYDPVAIPNAKKIFQNYPSFQNNIHFNSDQYKVLEKAQVLCITSDWKYFREPKFSLMKTLMSQHVIFDGRNQYQPEMMKKLGFHYYSIGRPIV